MQANELMIGYKWVVGYENLYAISDKGEVYSFRSHKNLWRYYEENILIDWDGRITRVTHDMANLCESVELRDAKVHELQHALRLCGLNDLADNFVI